MQTLSGHSREGAWAFKRGAEIGCEVGRVADLAFGPEDLLGSPRSASDDIKDGIRVRAGESSQEDPVIGRLAEAGPLKIQQRCQL
jgi:hypothetical protein